MNEPLSRQFCRRVQNRRRKDRPPNGMRRRKGSCMTVRTEKPTGFRPRLVLALADSARAALSCRLLRRLGWAVHLAGSGPEVCRLVRALDPLVVVLDMALRGESGW